MYIPNHDRVPISTINDLMLRYRLSDIATTKKGLEESNTQLTATNKELQSFKTATTTDIDTLKSQVDGNVTTWFFSGTPTLENAPATDWTTDELKDEHIGDLYYDRDTGFSYKFTKTDDVYSWEDEPTTSIVQALAIANAAKDTADNKRRNFVNTPTPPYDEGDIWTTNNGDIKLCVNSKTSDEIYDETDFEIQKTNVYIPNTTTTAVGSDGVKASIVMYSNVISAGFVGGSCLLPCGYSQIGEDIYSKDSLQFDVTIPSNFTITEAKITINHIPVKYYEIGVYQRTGYSRNMKLYKTTGFTTGYLYVETMGADIHTDNFGTWSEISNAFGSTGFTGSDSGHTSSESIDIKSSLSTGFNTLRIETSVATPVSYADMNLKTGACNAILVITGYLS